MQIPCRASGKAVSSRQKQHMDKRWPGGKGPKAERLFQQALEAEEEVLGKEHPEVSAVVRILAVVRYLG